MSKKEFKKPINKKENSLVEEEDKGSLIIILVAIVCVIGLILTSLFLFSEDEKLKPSDDGKEVDGVLKPIEQSEEQEEEKIVVVTKYVVKYLDIEGNQIGKTQKVLDLEDRTNEKAPKILGQRFVEWMQRYNRSENVYYYVPIYVANVERIPQEEEKYLEEEIEEKDSYTVTISEVKLPTDEVDDTGEPVIPVTSPTYEVEVSGLVEDLSAEDIDESITISEEYNYLVGLKFNAPEDITEEDIQNMMINVYATDPNQTLEEDQYHYNGEDPSKTGRDLLDSTDEEYENGIYYFYYYQEVETQTNSTVEVYWGNDPQEDLTSDPPVEAQDEYIEVYNINVENVKLEQEIVTPEPPVTPDTPEP